ncbi:MAG TPA: SDR family oxidoreductase [Planctomycetota bacterium]|nr:SDR family oxidoreductase [Planctomycetota bacterium]
MRVLVSGGAGFIGGHLAEALVEAGHQVRVVDNFSTGNAENLAAIRDQIELLDLDLSDPADALQAAEGMDAISHQAAVPSVPRSVKDPLESHAACASTTVNLLNAAKEHGIRRFVYAASSSAYGDGPELPKTESMRPDPRSPYAVAKLAGEFYVSAFSSCYGLDAISLRYFNIFGPRQDPSSPYSGVIARFTTLMMQGQTPVIFGDGTQTRDFTYVANVVHANMLALTTHDKLNGCAVNIGTGLRISLNQLVAELNKILGTNLQPRYEAPRTGDVMHSVASLAMAQGVLGYKPVVDFSEGLARTVQSARVPQKSAA